MSTAKKSKTKRSTELKTFADHIGELRVRVMWVALLFVIASSVAYNFREVLVKLVLAPLGDQKLIYLTPAGGFSFIFQITMYAGAVVTAPLIVYHLYKFVQPALPPKATRYSLRVVLAATVLMLGGVSFGYFVAIPSALHFLTAFAGSYIEASLTADSYLSFVVAYVVGLGLLFQLPLLLIFWNWIHPMGPGKLLNSQRFLIVFAFVVAAMITPTPDVVNQSLVAGPIILIYQIGVVSVFIMNRKHRKAVKHAARVIKQQPIVQTPVEPMRPLRTHSPNLSEVLSLVEHKPVKPVVAAIPKPSPAVVVPAPTPIRRQIVTERQTRPLVTLPRPLPKMTRSAVSLDGISRISRA